MTIDQDLLPSLPPVLVLALVPLAPVVSFCRSLLQLLSWSRSWYSSWLLIGLWWALCLVAGAIFRYLLLLALAAAYIVLRDRNLSRPQQSLATEQTLRTIVTDLSIIQSLLPSIHFLHIAPLTLLRASVILSVPYVLLASFFALRTICAILGTTIITWRAPWVVVIRTTLWRSAWFRWSIYKTWAFLIGQPLSKDSITVATFENASRPAQTLRFLFTIYENQRWWMGLDWTAALLPAERPSWCSSTQNPISPPNAFTLPENTSVYLTDGNGVRMRHTAVWRWEEPEWRVLVHKEGSAPIRIERSLPSVKEESPAGSRLMKAAGRLRESGSNGSVQSGASMDNSRSPTTDFENMPDEMKQNQDEEQLTDADGWVYGDNKWENQSNKGGMSKYTRFRRWTRIAVVFEVVEPTDAGQRLPEPSSPTIIKPPSLDLSPSAATDSTPTTSIDSVSESPLRQRLRQALQQNQTR